MVLFLNKILFLVGISSSSCSPSSLKSCFSSSILLPPNILLTRLPGNYVLTSASIASKDSPFCFLFSLSPLPLSTCQISLSTFFFFFILQDYFLATQSNTSYILMLAHHFLKYADILPLSIPKL